MSGELFPRNLLDRFREKSIEEAMEEERMEFDDWFYSMDGNVVCISEEDAEKFAELAGVEVEIECRRKPKYRAPKKTISSSRYREKNDFFLKY